MRAIHLLLIGLVCAIQQTAQASACATASDITQFAVVDAADGYVNLRDDKQKIVGRYNNQAIVYVFGSGGGHWCEIDSPRQGLIHDSGLKLVSSFSRIPFSRATKNSVEFGNQQISVQLSAEPFNKKAHRYTYDKVETSVVQKIDGAEYYGRDGDLPGYQYQSIRVTINGKTISLPAQALHNLYEPNAPDPVGAPLTKKMAELYMGVHYDQKNDVLYIDSMNGDGSGAYHVLWVIQHGQYLARYVASPF